MTPDQIIAQLELTAHPEGGHYRETWRGPAVQGRSSGTAIYFLLRRGERSAWHRIDAAEIWHHYAGAPLTLRTCQELGEQVAEVTLGPDIADGQHPQHIIEPNQWQSAQSQGDFTLVGCTVSPGFEFEHFELAPE